MKQHRALYRLIGNVRYVYNAQMGMKRHRALYHPIGNAQHVKFVPAVNMKQPHVLYHLIVNAANVVAILDFTNKGRAYLD
jgi:hypothetical protein